MKNAWRIGRVFGIDIRIDSSWLLIFVFFSWYLGGSYFPKAHPEASRALDWGLGVVTSLLFFGSVLAHELAHSFVAKKQGETVSSITLFILGGVAQIKEEPDEPLKEFGMAIVGPLSSFALAALFFLVSVLVAPKNGPAGSAAFFLFTANMTLGVFNLLPGFPMDGGRVFRSIVWKITGDLKKATRLASLVGDAIALLMIASGVFFILNGKFDGLWWVLVGWFLHNASRQGYAQVMLKSALAGLKARDLMTTEFETVPAGLPVQALVDDYILKKKEHVFLVTVGGELRGIVCLDDVKALRREEWANAPVSSIMTAKDRLQSVGLDADGNAVLASLATRDVNQVPVLEDGRVVGIICRTDVLKVLQLRSDLGV